MSLVVYSSELFSVSLRGLTAVDWEEDGDEVFREEMVALEEGVSKILAECFEGSRSSGHQTSAHPYFFVMALIIDLEPFSKSRLVQKTSFAKHH